MSDIGDRIRALRIERGLSQRQLADESGLTQRQISAIETADAVVSLTEIAFLSDALSVLPDVLLGTAAADPDARPSVVWFERHVADSARLRGIEHDIEASDTDR